MLTLVWLLLGLVLAAAFIYWIRSMGAALELRALTAGLLIAALIYVGFAVTWGNGNWILVELAGVAAYGIFAFLTYRFSSLWLAAGWGVHPAWDALLRLIGPGQTIAPYWYAIACISFDILVAAYIVKRYPVWTVKTEPGP